MKFFIHCTTPVTGTRLLIGVLMLVGLSASAGVSRAAQLIPSLGFTQSTDSNAGDGKLSGGLALRVPLLPFLSAEGGITYREQSFPDNDLKVRMWPVTASLWLNPVPMLYAGGGLGWYRTTFDNRSTLPFTDTTTDTTMNKVGVHLGGGLAVPVGPSLGLDLNGRYVFMQEEDRLQFPTDFKPDFWTASLGLAIKF